MRQLDIAVALRRPHLSLHDASFVSSAVTSAAVSDDTEIFSAHSGRM